MNMKTAYTLELPEMVIDFTINYQWYGATPIRDDEPAEGTGPEDIEFTIKEIYPIDNQAISKSDCLNQLYDRYNNNIDNFQDHINTYLGKQI